MVLPVFGIVFLAELPDKTALAGLVLGTRYRPSYVFAGTAAAFAVHVVLAIAAGSLLALLPRVLEVIVGALFLLGAVLMLHGRDEGDEERVEIGEGHAPTFIRVAATSFLVILVAEFGDLTQIVTANLAAKSLGHSLLRLIVPMSHGSPRAAVTSLQSAPLNTGPRRPVVAMSARTSRI